MTQLAVLHSGLARLRTVRMAVRWGMAAAALAIVVPVVLLVAFLLDWQLQFDRLQRGLSLLCVLAVAGWAVYRWCLPWLKRRETELDVALKVEQQQHIESDLVAALQFETPVASGWGSPQLEHAVIRYVDEFSGSLNVFEGFDWSPLRRRAIPAAAVVLLTLTAVVLFPGYASAFFNRLLLGTAHYPSATQIAAVRINGQEIDVWSGEPVVFRSPHGLPLVFEIDSAGVLPAHGMVLLEGTRQGGRVSLSLTEATLGRMLPRQPGESPQNESAENPAFTGTATAPASPDSSEPAVQEDGLPEPGTRGEATWSTRLPRLVTTARLQIFLGDAWTDPRTIEVIPLPVVLPEVEVIPPAYAAGALEVDETPPGLLQHSVLQGSRISLAVKCANKSLANATVTIDGRQLPLVAAAGDASRWLLADAGSPFHHVTEPFEYRIQVTDTDGLTLPSPIRGQVRLRVDREPRIAAAFASRHYIPTASPQLSWGASDDFGLQLVKLHIQVVRADGREDEHVETIHEATGRQQPPRRLRSRYQFDLAALQLAKGDELKVAVEVADWRGTQPSQSTFSEPLVLQITDREGILAGLLESDERTARQLDAIIERQLGIGETR